MDPGIQTSVSKTEGSSFVFAAGRALPSIEHRNDDRNGGEWQDSAIREWQDSVIREWQNPAIRMAESCHSRVRPWLSTYIVLISVCCTLHFVFVH